MSYVEPLMRQNFLEYASYVIVDRAIPDIRDGCKPVQRRILSTLFDVDDGRFHKVANVIGECMKLHPHGDASIGDALVVLASKEYFIEKQGNFGNILTGHPAAASRYIECRLTPLAKETLFNKALTEYQPSYDGRKLEPVALPVKLPVILMLGTEGIAVGMATRILPHNFCELLQAQIKLLEKGTVELFPDFPQGGLLDASEYADGKGKVRVRALLEADKDKKTITVKEVPFSTTTESLIVSIETAAQKGKVKIATIEDRTAEEVEIVLRLARGVYSDEVIPQLYAYTNCEVAITSNIVVIKDQHPYEPTITEVLETLTKRLREQIKAELELELKRLEDRQHALTLEQIFIEQRVYKRIEEAKTAEEVHKEVWIGMQRYKRRFVRPMEDEDVERLLEIKIRRISAYDIEKNRKDIDATIAGIKACNTKLRNLTKTTVTYLRGILEKYGDKYPRKTQLTTFDVVNKKAVARQNLKVSYDPKSSFFGHAVRGTEFSMTVSEYDKILALSSDGTYRVMSPPDKILLPRKVLWAGVFNEEEGHVFTLVYRDKAKEPWGKLIHIQRYIRDKEYELIKDKDGKIDFLIEGESDRQVQMNFTPKKGQRLKEAVFDLAELEYCGLTARGTRLAKKPVSRVKLLRNGG